MSGSIRLSVGTAAVLNLIQCKLDAPPTTAYTMTFTENRCSANCGFCAQARGSSARANQLSRIPWPNFPFSKVLKVFKLKASEFPFKRLCIQTLCYPHLIRDLKQLVSTFRQILPNIPLSLALPPLDETYLQYFFDNGVDRVAISLDAITPKIFESIKGRGVNGPFTWEQHHMALKSALTIFGESRTTTHLIIGLGETEQETVNLIQNLTNQGITISLFPFTPIIGTNLEKQARPTIEHYRRIQLAHYLIQNQLSNAEKMEFNSVKNQIISFGISTEALMTIITRGTVFQTAGCPSCNRPFFTEQPGGPLYNYPHLPNAKSLNEIRNQLKGVL